MGRKLLRDDSAKNDAGNISILQQDAKSQKILIFKAFREVSYLVMSLYKQSGKLLTLIPHDIKRRLKSIVVPK